MGARKELEEADCNAHVREFKRVQSWSIREENTVSRQLVVGNADEVEVLELLHCISDVPRQTVCRASQMQSRDVA